MASFIIEGGNPLHGEITPQGAKNEALQVLCATLLTREPVIVRNVPDIRDVKHLLDLLRDMGATVEKTGEGEWRIEAKRLNGDFLKSRDFVVRSAKLRGSVMLLGAQLGRRGKAYLAKPGGDQIGRRRLDTHLMGLQKLGAKFDYNTGSDACHVTTGHAGLQGCYILLDEASVTGTANIILAAVRAKGTTTIYNAACEPYVQQLCRMLNCMGARITGIGSNLLTIEGVDELHGTVHECLPDMIEVGSFIAMAAMTRSEITIKNCSVENLGIIPEQFGRLGVNVVQVGDDLIVPQQDHYRIESFMDGSIMTIADAPWPGLSPDLLSVMLVVATQCAGAVLIHQKMFESRLFFVDKLIDMGAQIILCDPHRAVVIGHDNQRRLKPNDMSSPDIRAGIALLIAALSADGTSVIRNAEQIDRGYENIEERLRSLGAKIRRDNDC